MGIGEFGYGLPNSALEHEKLEFAVYLSENFDGRILRDAVSLDYLHYVHFISADDADIKSFKSTILIINPESASIGPPIVISNS